MLFHSMHMKIFHGFVDETSSCRCGIVDMKKNSGFYGNSLLRDMQRNGERLKNSYENRVNDEF